MTREFFRLIALFFAEILNISAGISADLVPIILLSH